MKFLAAVATAPVAAAAAVVPALLYPPAVAARPLFVASPLILGAAPRRWGWLGRWKVNRLPPPLLAAPPPPLDVTTMAAW